MALNGRTKSAYYGKANGFRIYVDWTASQSNTGNYSLITARLYMQTDSYNFTPRGSGDTAWIEIDGVRYSKSGLPNVGKGQTKMIWSVSNKKVTHNKEGEKTFDIRANYTKNGVVSFNITTPSTSFKLDSLASASKIVSYPSRVTIGDDINTTIERESNAYVHDYSLYIGDKYIGEWMEQEGTSHTLTMNSTHIDRMYEGLDATDGSTLRIGLRTKVKSDSGYKVIGERRYVYVHLDVPSSASPTIDSITFTDEVDNTANVIGLPVQNHSKLKMSYGVTPKKGATIKSYRVTIDGKSYSGASPTTDTIQSSGNLPIKLRVTDSRGATATKTVYRYVQPYKPPKVTKFDVYRSNSSGVENPLGRYLTFDVSAEGTPLRDIQGTDKNGIRLVIQTARKDEKGQPITPWTYQYNSNIVKNFSESFTKGTFAINDVYAVRLRLTDLYNTALSNKEVSVGIVPFSWGKRGMAVGKVYNDVDTFEVGGTAMIDGNISFEGGLLQREDIKTLSDDGKSVDRFTDHTGTLAGLRAMKMGDNSTGKYDDTNFPDGRGSWVYFQGADTTGDTNGDFILWKGRGSNNMPLHVGHVKNGQATDFVQLEAVKEMGKNSSGTYIHFVDGTAIAYRKMRMSLSTNAGGTVDTPNYNYPMTFTETPYVSLRIEASEVQSVTNREVFTHRANFRVRSTSKSNTRTYDMWMFMMGRWR